jgi:hypothetical protein
VKLRNVKAGPRIGACLRRASTPIVWLKQTLTILFSAG